MRGAGGELPAERPGAGSARLRLFLGLRLCPPHQPPRAAAAALGLLGAAARACAAAGVGNGPPGQAAGAVGAHGGVSPPTRQQAQGDGCICDLGSRGGWMGASETSAAFAKPLPSTRRRSVAWQRWYLRKFLGALFLQSSLAFLPSGATSRRDRDLSRQGARGL